MNSESAAKIVRLIDDALPSLRGARDELKKHSKDLLKDKGYDADTFFSLTLDNVEFIRREIAELVSDTNKLPNHSEIPNS